MFNMVDEHILLKYFSGDVSPDELQTIEEWITASAENKRQAEEIYHIYFSTATLHRIQNVGTISALNKVNKRIDSFKRKLFLGRLQRVAAVLFIPFFCISLYLLFPANTDSMEYMEVQTIPGMVTSVVLPDQSKVWLNTGSKLVYPVKFTGKSRTVKLVGEGYFEVSRNGKNKFMVETSKGINVEVLGTEFNIEAYPEDENVTTTLISGKVKLNYISDENRSVTSSLSPGYQSVYNTNDRKAVTSQAVVSVTTAWKDMKVILRRTSFGEMLKLLGKRFDVEFIVLNKKLNEYNFTGIFDEQQLPKILEHLRISSGVKYRIIDSKAGEEGIREKTKIELF